MTIQLQMAEIIPDNQNRNFNTKGIWQPPLKNRNSKIRLHSALSWPKIRIEPKCHGYPTSGGWDYPGQTHRHTTFLNYICRWGYRLTWCTSTCVFTSHLKQRRDVAPIMDYCPNIAICCFFLNLLGNHGLVCKKKIYKTSATPSCRGNRCPH